MKCDCNELFELYKEMFFLHTGTKTNDIVFHKASEGFYETLFAVAHGVAEAMQDTKMSSPLNAEESRKKSYGILEKAKTMLESMVKENSDVAMDNVLRGLVDKLGFECGTARGFGGSDASSEPASNQEASDKEESDEVKTEEPEETDENEANEVEDESKDESGDVSSYGMAIEIKPADEEMDVDNMTHEEMKAHMKKMMEKKNKADESNNKMR